MHFSTLTFGFNGGSCGQPSSLEGGEPRVTTKMPAGDIVTGNRSQKLISINKILGLQKYRLFLHYLFYSEQGQEHKDNSRSILRGMNFVVEQ